MFPAILANPATFKLPTFSPIATILEKLLLILMNASRISSPVPSFGTAPTFIS